MSPYKIGIQIIHYWALQNTKQEKRVKGFLRFVKHRQITLFTTPPTTRSPVGWRCVWDRDLVVVMPVDNTGNLQIEFYLFFKKSCNFSNK